MDGNGSMNMRNWGFFEPATTALKGHLGLQLMSTMAAERPLFGGGGSRDQHPHHHHHNQQQPQHHQTHHAHPALMDASTNSGGLFHHPRIGGLTESSVGVDYMRDSWINYNREKYLNMLPNNNNHHHSSYDVLPESSSAHSMQMLQTNNLPKNDSVPSHPQLQDSCEERDVGLGLVKKRGGAKVQVDKSPKAKKAKRAPRALKDENTPSVQRARAPKKGAEVVINGISMDISGIPIPICTCTGTPQQCYRWGSGGWQSACCTTGLSMYPLPMSTKRRGARIAGRKMSIGAFKKVLEKLASEDYSFSNPIDLRNYWAKHGTNKFVTIRTGAIYKVRRFAMERKAFRINPGSLDYN